MFEVPGNIARLWVDGTEVERFHDIGSVPEFEVETDSGLRYRVLRRPVPNSRTVECDVLALSEDEGISELPVGVVTKHNPRMARNLEYLFKKHGALFNGGYQSDLSNAAQSPIE